MKLTVSEYAKELGVSTQSIYKKIKSGVVTTVKVNNVTYVVLADSTVSDGDTTKVYNKVASEESDLMSIIKSQRKDHRYLMKENKRLTKEIQRLTLALSECSKTKEDVFLQYITELKQLQITHQEPEEIVIREKKKKKGKRKKR